MKNRIIIILRFLSVTFMFVVTMSFANAQTLLLPDAVSLAKKPVENLKKKLEESGYKQADVKVHIGDTRWTYRLETATDNNLVVRQVIVVRFKGKQLSNYIAYITSDSTEAPPYKDWIQQNQYTLTKTDNSEVKALTYKKEGMEVELNESKVYDNWTNYGYIIRVLYPK